MIYLLYGEFDRTHHLFGVECSFRVLCKEVKVIKVIRTEIHLIKKNNPLWLWCDDLCFKSKNLYNSTNYLIRQEFIKNNNFISGFDANKIMKDADEFKSMMAKSSQQTILLLSKNWKSFFKSLKRWSKDKSGYTGKPKLPKYKDKNGRFPVMFDYCQAKIKNNQLYIPFYKLYLPMNNTQHEFRLLRIIPYGSCYKIEIVYRKEIEPKKESNKSCIAIDLGINNFATITNNIGLKPIIINGRVIKSINQYYSKLKSQAQSYIIKGSSKRIKRIGFKRNNIMNTHIHRISRWIINYCIENNISKIVIGENKDWKRNMNIGKKNNQAFSQIPFSDFINKIKYKAEEVGIEIVIVDERYTSRSSFIDNDILPDKFGEYEFSGKRIKRGLYKSKNNVIINADVNGSYNILRKCNPEFKFDDRIEVVSLQPIKVNIT